MRLKCWQSAHREESACLWKYFFLLHLLLVARLLRLLRYASVSVAFVVAVNHDATPVCLSHACFPVAYMFLVAVRLFQLLLLQLLQ